WREIHDELLAIGSVIVIAVGRSRGLNESCDRQPDLLGKSWRRLSFDADGKQRSTIDEKHFLSNPHRVAPAIASDLEFDIWAGRIRLKINLTPATLVGFVDHPSTIRGKDRVLLALDLRNDLHCRSCCSRVRPYVVVETRPVLRSEQEQRAMERPTGGSVIAGHSGGCREPFGLAGTIGTLHENEIVSFAIGLKNNLVAVVRPERTSVRRASEGQPQRRCLIGNAVYEDVALIAIVYRVRQLFAIRRNPRCFIQARR